MKKLKNIFITIGGLDYLKTTTATVIDSDFITCSKKDLQVFNLKNPATCSAFYHVADGVYMLAGRYTSKKAFLNDINCLKKKLTDYLSIEKNLNYLTRLIEYARAENNDPDAKK